MFKSWRNARVGVKAAIIGGIFVLLAAVINIVNWECIIPKKDFRFKKDNIGVLILPFAPLENCIAKDEDMAKAVYFNLKKQIIDDSLINFKVRYLSEGLREGFSCPGNHDESRDIGNEYLADIVIWGVHCEKAFPEISRVSINYTITNPNDYNLHASTDTNSTGLQVATTEGIYEGKLVEDVNYVVCFLVGQYYYNNRKLQQAVKYFTKATEFVNNKFDSVLVDVFFNLGYIYRLQNNYEESIKNYMKVLQINPNFMRALVFLGLTYTETEQHQKATEYYNRIVKMNPISDIDFNIKGVAYNGLQQFQKAIKEYNKAIEKNPKFAQAYNNRAFAYINMGQYQKAIEDCNKAIELNSNLVLAYSNRAGAYVYLGQYQKAIEDCNTAIKLNPTLAQAYNNRGLAYSNLGEYQNAIEDYDKAIGLNPELAHAYSNRAFAYINLGQYQKAIEDCNKAIELNPKHVLAYSNRAGAYIKLGQFQEAIEDCNKAIELNPNNPVNYYNKACIYCSLHNKDKSIQSLKKAFENGLLNLYPVEAVKEDPDLKCIQDDPHFKKLIEQYSK